MASVFYTTPRLTIITASECFALPTDHACTPHEVQANDIDVHTSSSMISPTEVPILLSSTSFFILWMCEKIGCAVRPRVDPVDHDDFGVILTATLTLLGLIVGFTFSMAINRYDQRKLYEEEEANAIATEYARTELLSLQEGETLRTLLRNYLDLRIQFYETRGDKGLQRIGNSTSALQAELWAKVKNPSLAKPTPIMALVVSGMNDVLNSQGYTLAAWLNRIPLEAWALMAIIAISGNFMVGLYLRTLQPNKLFLSVLPAVISLCFFLIADIDSPRGGLIHVKPVNLIGVAHVLRTASPGAPPCCEKLRPRRTPVNHTLDVARSTDAGIAIQPTKE